MRDRLAFLAYLAGWRLVRALPERLAYALFTLIADIGGGGTAPASGGCAPTCRGRSPAPRRPSSTR